MRLVMKAQFYSDPPVVCRGYSSIGRGIRFQSEVAEIYSSIGGDRNKNGTFQFIKDKNNSAAVYASSSLTVYNPFLFAQ